ncbi:Hypothetical protein A7982_04680 [Minicystis rosea]|nr:Hypothetical protein A7982_04680 [Minicystis rosea]
MVPSIAELKHRYLAGVAEHRLLPIYDRAISVPLSTGDPLFDAALTEKLVATGTLSEAEHLRRAWHLVRGADAPRRGALARHARGLLNDHKLLLALDAWARSDEEATGAFLTALPLGWQLAFPTAVIKPAATMFTGWRRDLSFRLVEEPRYEALRELFRAILARTPGVAVLRYRSAIKASAALLRYRFEGERERAIHDLCFEGTLPSPERAAELDLEPAGTFVRARLAAREGAAKLADALDASAHPLPITVLLGLLGATRTRLDDAGADVARLREHAVRGVSVVESLLRLAEWSPWLEERHAEALGARARRLTTEVGIDLPFHRVVNAFAAAPRATREMFIGPLLAPLLRAFGARLAELLPPPGPVTFLMPAAVFQWSSFLLQAILASAHPTALLLAHERGVDARPGIPLDELLAHLADDKEQIEAWALTTFGRLGAESYHRYDGEAIVGALAKLDPEVPLILDLPWFQPRALVGALRRHARVFNLGEPAGAPGEIGIDGIWYVQSAVMTNRYATMRVGREPDQAARMFAQAIDRLAWFQRLAAEVGS